MTVDFNPRLGYKMTMNKEVKMTKETATQRRAREALGV